jgi:hypothetical protein
MDPYEDAPMSTPREIFARLGYFPEPPSELEDKPVAGPLWELIHAMAARRFFLLNTNHLSDRQLYEYLAGEWLDEETADMPPEAGWNCHVDMSEQGGPEDWLRYYADDIERAEWAAHADGEPLPAKREPMYDRDDRLPVPPGEAMDEDGDPFDGDEEMDDDILPAVPGEMDPLGLRAVENAIHRERPLDDMGGDDSSGYPPDSGGDDVPGDDEVSGRWAKPIDLLPEHGVNLLPPAELTDDSVRPCLWEVLQAMAEMGVFVQHTDHLGDRALYEALWQHVLRQDAFLPGDGMESAWVHDFIGSDQPEDRALWLACYASDDERRAEQRADGRELPPKQVLVANRDWRLPRSALGI